jgi:hypothetical protein
MCKISARVYHNGTLIAVQPMDVSPAVGSLISYGNNVICKINKITICMDKPPNDEGRTIISIACVDENPENKVNGLLNMIQDVRNIVWQLEKGNDPRTVQQKIDVICSQIMMEIETKKVNFYGIA